MPNDVRHVLVVATQCENMPVIKGLDQAATDLYQVLTDPAAGACEPGLPGGRSLRIGATVEQIRADLGAAVKYARERDATLVLALLGHAFIPGEESTLYFMGTGSRDGDRDGALCVNDVVRDTVDSLSALVAIVDSCNAAAGFKDAVALRGNRLGRSRLSLLLASSAGQNAYDLVLSRELTALLAHGADDAPPRIDVGTAAGRINQVADQQSVGCATFDGNPRPDSPLWLGHNRRYARSSGLLGSRGRRALREALDAVEAANLRAYHDVSAIDELDDLTTALRALPWSIYRERALEVAGDLRIAMRTTDLIRRDLRTGLTRQRLCAALHFAIPERSPADLFDDTDFVEEIALGYPAGEGSCLTAMARFVASLADAAGLDENARALVSWVDDARAAVQFGDAWQLLATRAATRRLRLVVSLHDYPADGEQPDSLEAWVLDDAGNSVRHETFDCERPPGPLGTDDQGGIEQALVAAVDWAEGVEEEIGSQGVMTELRRLDVALSTRLLLTWRPEEVLHTTWLGVDYDVVRHWVRRTDTRMRRHAEKRMNAIEDGTTAERVQWLTATDTRDVVNLKHRLESGEFLRALAVAHDLKGNERLAELLLTFTPILVWASGDDELRAQHQAYTTANWHRLPEGFLEAYRDRWGRRAADCLADLRFVWDDLRWLQFCRAHSNWPPR